jgi:hypothetical protein
MFYGAYSPGSRDYGIRHNDGCGGFLCETHDALVPLITNCPENTSKKQLRLQNFFSSEPELFRFHAAAVVFFSAALSISRIYHFNNKYLTCIIFLQTLK